MINESFLKVAILPDPSASSEEWPIFPFNLLPASWVSVPAHNPIDIDPELGPLSKYDNILVVTDQRTYELGNSTGQRKWISPPRELFDPSKHTLDPRHFECEPWARGARILRTITNRESCYRIVFEMGVLVIEWRFAVLGATGEPVGEGGFSVDFEKGFEDHNAWITESLANPDGIVDIEVRITSE